MDTRQINVHEPNLPTMPNKGYVQTIEHRKKNSEVLKRLFSEGIIKGSLKGKFKDSHPNWKGGKRINEQGYVVYNTDHGTGRKNVKEHRLVMEKHLGRLLRPSEIIHHINGKKTDNRIENLQLTERTKHDATWQTTCPKCNHTFIT